jgi:hypothetical protein
VLNPVVTGSGLASPVLNPNAVVDSWAVDGFAMLDLWGWNFVAYGYTGKAVGITGLFFNGIDAFGDARMSDGGYASTVKWSLKSGLFSPGFPPWPTPPNASSWCHRVWQCGRHRHRRQSQSAAASPVPLGVPC